MFGRRIEIVLSIVLAPGLVISCKVLLEDELAVTNDDHGVNVGFGFLEPRRDGAQPYTIEAGAFRRIDRPAVAKCGGYTASRISLAQRLRGRRSEHEDGGEAEAPQLFATLAHAAVSCSRCYAGGGTEIFTDGRSSIFWWKASSFG